MIQFTSEKHFNQGFAQQVFSLCEKYQYTGEYYYDKGQTWFVIKSYTGTVAITNTHPHLIE